MPRARKDGSISDGQRELLARAVKHGGILERRTGAIWTAPGTPSAVPGGPPIWSYLQRMVTDLINRGYMEPIEMYELGRPPYPLKAKITEKGASIIS